MIDLLAVLAAFSGIAAVSAFYGWRRAATANRQLKSECDRLYQNLTECRSRESRSRQAEDLIGHIINTVPLPFSYIDRKGCVLYANDRYQDWFGTSLDRTDKTLDGDMKASMAKALDGTAASFETSLPVGGEPRPIGVTLMPHRNEEREVIGFAVIFEDLTERNKRDETLQRTEATTRAILDAAVDGIITIDERGQIGSFNRAAEKIFGYTASEVAGRNVNILMPEPYHSAHDGYIRNYTSGGRPRIIGVGREVAGRRKDGSTFPMDLAVGESSLVGRRIFAGIVRDISQRKETEEQLRRAKEEAERANLAKSKFLAAASHDLRQPVQALFFFISALSHKLRENPARDIVTDVERSLESLNNLLDSLLDVSKLDAGVVTPSESVFSVETVIGHMEAEFAPSAAVKGLKLRMVPSSAVIRSDPTLLGRILQNFVTNAIRYTRHGRVLVGCRRRGRMLRIEIWDSGIGIPENRLGDIFEEFYQIGNSERDRAQGLGLGLAIVSRLAKLLGHRIDVKSWPGKGSLFAIEVPLAEGRPLSPVRRSAATAADLEGSRKLIVIIDDEATVLRGLSLVLENWGFAVLAAGSAEEAMQLLSQRTERPNAILADYRLREGHTGTEAIRHIRDFFNSPIPSIIITGDTAPERLREAEASGFSILHKPVQPPQLQSLLADTLHIH